MLAVDKLIFGLSAKRNFQALYRGQLFKMSTSRVLYNENKVLKDDPEA